MSDYYWSDIHLCVGDWVWHSLGADGSCIYCGLSPSVPVGPTKEGKQ